MRELETLRQEKQEQHQREVEAKLAHEVILHGLIRSDDPDFNENYEKYVTDIILAVEDEARRFGRTEPN